MSRTRLVHALHLSLVNVTVSAAAAAVGVGCAGKGGSEEFIIVSDPQGRSPVGCGLELL